QHLVIDLHLFGGVTRLRLTLRDHDSNRVAYVAHRLGGQGGVRRHLHGCAVLGMDHPAADQISDFVGGELFTREHINHPRHCPGGGDIDALDLRVSVRRADKRGPGFARANNVVSILALARNEAEVFFSAHRRAYARRAHGGLLPLNFDAIRRPDARPPWPWLSLLPQWL